MAPDLQDGSTSWMAVNSKPETRIKETSVVNSELAHHWINRHHFRGQIWRDVNSLAGRKYVELVWIQNQFLVIADINLLPKISGVIFGDHV